MKIAICLFHYFPYGGLQRDFLRIAKTLLQRGHELHVFTMRWQGERVPGLNVHLLPQKAWFNHSKIRRFSHQAHEAIQHMNVDYVLGFNKMPHLDAYYAADVCYQARAKKKYGILIRFLPRIRQYIRYEKAVFEYGLSTEILLIAAKQQTVFMHYYHTEPSRFHLLPPGIAKDRCISTSASMIRDRKRKELGIDHQSRLVLQIGSGFKTKGLDRSLIALAHLPSELKQKVKLYVVGQDHSKKFKQFAKQLGVADQVKFLGGRDDVPELLQAADALIHPAYHENTGTVLLEALVANLPVLTTDVCGYAHYIEESKAGIVISSPFLQQHLNQALVDILQAQNQIKMRKNASDYAKEADIYSMPEKASDYIERFAEQKNAVFAS